jgi:hypothetical protein
MNRKLLAIYLNDHLAWSTLGLDLARRALGNNRGSELGAFLERLVEEIREDRRSLEELMDRLEIGRDRPKLVGAWAAEKIGRLKLNGSLLSYSSLSRLVELEWLSLGVEGKRCLWQALEDLGVASEVEGIDLKTLIRRAEDQRTGLERHRREAARTALVVA